MIGIVQAIAFTLLVALAMVGANALDRQLAACSARAGFIEVLAP